MYTYCYDAYTNAMLYHLSRLAARTATVINNGSTILFVTCLPRDIRAMVQAGYTPFSSLGVYECADIPKTTIILHLH